MRVEPLHVAASRVARFTSSLSIVRGLVLAVAIGWCAAAPAQDANTPIDGLSADVRSVLYNAGTSLVARLDLTQLSHDRMLQTVHGLFEPSEYAAFLNNTRDFETQLEQYLTPTKASAAMSELDYKTVTVVVMQGTMPFAAVRLGDKVDETTFAGAALGIQGALKLAGFSVSVVQSGDYALIGDSKSVVPSLPHTQSIEDAILLGLQQAPGAPAVVFVSPVDEALRAQLASNGSSSPEFTAAIGQADYIGGYLVTGPEPQLHLYIRYSSETTAGNVKATYDRAWEQLIAQADTEDANNQASNIKEVSYINNGEMMRRIQAGMRVTMFNGIVKLDLDTLALRQITSAVVDRYYRKPPDSDTTPPPDTGAPADNGAPVNNAPVDNAPPPDAEGTTQ